MNTFNNFNLDPLIIKALEEQGITEPSEIQEKVIPKAMLTGDIVAKAPTGTGKTLGYLLPILSKIEQDSKNTQALILCPTRELVIQISDVLKGITKYYEGVRSAALYGGQNIQRQLMCLRKRPQIIVGTPGRILDHLDRHTVKFEKILTLVLDEGDEMFDMGFRNDIESIMDHCNKDCQKLLFSATIPDSIKKVIDARFNNPETISATIDGDNIPQIDQYYTMIKDAQRVAALLYLKQKYKYLRCIVFCNTKMRAERLNKALISKEQSVVLLHGDLKQAARTNIMKGFKNGEYEILVATDVAARGIDVDNIEAIFNFDPPTDSDFYVHRIGRTARANATGAAYTFIDANQTSYIQSYQQATKNALKYLELDDDLGDSFTLPRDGSNRMSRAKVKTVSKRFFLNVGSKDMLDKDTLSKLVKTKCGIEMYEIVDVKVRDVYSFVEVVESKAEDIYKLKGIKIGTRIINVEETRSDKEDKKTSAPRKPRKESDSFNKDSDKRNSRSRSNHNDEDTDASKPRRRRDGEKFVSNKELKETDKKPRYSRESNDGEEKRGTRRYNNDKPRYSRESSDGEEKRGTRRFGNDKPRYSRESNDGEEKRSTRRFGDDKPRAKKSSNNSFEQKSTRPAKPKNVNKDTSKYTTHSKKKKSNDEDSYTNGNSTRPVRTNTFKNGSKNGFDAPRKK